MTSEPPERQGQLEQGSEQRRLDAEAGPELLPETVSEFLEWAAHAPVSAREVVRQRIAAARGNRDVASELQQRLWDLPVEDLGLHLVLLSTIGEFRDSPNHLGELARFVWYDGELAPHFGSEAESGACTFLTNYETLLKVRAAEMLAWLEQDDEGRETLGIVANHPDEKVRAAAIDSYLYSRGDSADASRRLAEVVRDDEQWMVGLPRFTRGMDPDEFSDALVRFYEQYPEERPPAVPRAAEPGSRPRARPD